MLRTLSQLQDRLDAEMGWRVKEMAEVKARIQGTSGARQTTMTRAGIVLLYAHWEGFVKSCAMAYIEFVVGQRHTLNELAECFVAMCAKGRINDFVSSNKAQVHIETVRFFATAMGQQATISMAMDKIVDAESNLGSKVLENILNTVGFDASRYSNYYKFIDERLVKTRNSIAHGENTYRNGIEGDTRATWYGEMQSETIKLMEFIKTDIENAAYGKQYLRS